MNAQRSAGCGAIEWLMDAAGLLDLTPQALADELVASMLRNVAFVMREGRLSAAVEHTPVTA
jgi:hypothetical protein